MYHEIAASRQITVGGQGRRPQIIVTSSITSTTADPTEPESSTKTKLEDEVDVIRGDEAKAALPNTPSAASLKRSHSSPPSSADDEKPSKKKPKPYQSPAEEKEEKDLESEVQQPLILSIPRNVVKKTLKEFSKRNQILWTPIDPSEVVLAFADADEAARAQQSSWTPNTAAMFMNKYHYPLVAFIQGLWCDEKVSERARAANKAALTGDAILRLQVVKRVDKVDNYTPEQQQELLDTILGRDFQSGFLHRTFQTSNPTIASAAQRHQLSSQVEHVLVFAGLPKLVRILSAYC